MTEALIKALRLLEETPNISRFEDDYIVRDIPIVLEASDIAETVLITSTGHCNGGAIEVLRQNGYGVFPIERDSFGWLIGGISTKVGILIYG